jgi:hypothetical protein
MADTSFSISDVISKSAVSIGGPWTGQTQIRIEATMLKCEQCQKTVKTKSELKSVSPILRSSFAMRGLG